MQGIVLTNKGIETVCADELTTFGVTRIAPSEHLVSFEYADEQDLCNIAYHAQTVGRVLKILLDTTTNDVLTCIRSSNDAVSSVSGSVRIDVSRFGTHTFSSVDVKQCAAALFSNISHAASDTTIHIIIVENRVVVGIDIAGIDLSKREYKVFTNSFSLKAPIACALVHMSKWTQGIFLDPLCRDGTIALEAAHLATNISVHQFESRKFTCMLASSKGTNTASRINGTIIASDSHFPNISAAKKNAKIAGMHKTIDFRRYDINDIDLQFDRLSVTAIATSCIRIPKNFFSRIYPILKPCAHVALLVQHEENCKDLAGAAGFTLVKQTRVWMGKSTHEIFVYKISTRVASPFV